jgi:hypothetical protein
MAPHPLVRRMVLTERTRAKYYGRPFKMGSCDCAKVAAFHAKLFGWKVPAPGRYNDLAGAQARLAEMDCVTLPDLVVKTGLAEIAPARVLTGDILSCPAEHDIGGLGISLGNGLMLAFHPDAIGMAVIRVALAERAWTIWPQAGNPEGGA